MTREIDNSQPFEEQCREQLSEGQELSSDQLERLQSMVTPLIGIDSPEANRLASTINRLRAENFRVRTVNYIDRLEEDYYSLESQFRNPRTPPEYMPELTEKLRETALSLRILMH